MQSMANPAQTGNRSQLRYTSAVSDAQERKDFLVRTPFFGGLEGATLELVIGMLTDRKFPASASVFQEGEQGRSMYIVRSGELLKYQSGESGRLVKLMRFHPGDFFGETTLIEIQPRMFTVVAESDALLFELTNMDLYRLYQEDVHGYVMVVQNMNRELCRRQRKADSRITEYADELGRTGTQMNIDTSGLRIKGTPLK
jgi:CRP/FNR family cyclic AMP-dependent transcriptional regulator